MLRSREYWQKRFILLNEQLLAKGESCLPQIESNYQAAIANLGEEINSFYAKFAQNNELSFAEAKRLLTTDERKVFQMTIDEYIIKGETLAVSKEWLKELENASLVYRVSRLQALQMQMRQQVEILAAAKDKTISEALHDIYTEGYYRSAYEIQRGLGVGSAFARLDENKIAKTLAKPWAPDGKNFSARIWGDDRSALLYKLQTTFSQGLIRGATSQSIISDITKTFNTSQKAAANLVLTESAFFASAARADCYKELGVEVYEFLATLDTKTCLVCADMDGRIFKAKEYQVGLTAPPLHPRDRCTTIPHFDDEFTADEKRSARDPVTGKTYEVSGDMTYPEWKKSIDEKHGVDSYNRERIKSQSIANDKLQHQKYRAIFGEDMPKSFAKFQDLKYNNSERWNDFKLQKQAKINSMDFSQMKGLVHKLGDKESRIWYDMHDKNIVNLIDKSKSLKEQAIQACNLRNQFRTQTRELMSNQERRKQLDITDPNKSFEELVRDKMSRKNLSREEAVEDIIKTATKTRSSINKKLGLE